MSDSSKCVTVFDLSEAPAVDAVSPVADAKQPEGRERSSEKTIRLIENWIVGVVTLLSAAVILVTLLANRERGPTLAPTSGHTTIDTVSIAR